ncbi:OmpA-like domain [Rhabdaerophilaceae bacterium]
MSTPRQWFFGLVPVFGILVAAGLTRQHNVEADLARKGTERLADAGFAWTKVAILGRDASLTGEAPAPGVQELAVAAAERVFGIRQVSDKTTLLPEQKPFAFHAVLVGSKLTLNGSLPPGAMRSQILDLGKRTFPAVQIDDQLKIARGASENFNNRLTFGLGELGKLSNGRMSLIDARLSLTGRAADLQKLTELRSRLAALPAGLTLEKGLGDGDLLPPIVSPYRFSAEKSETALVLDGFVSTEAERAAVLGLANAMGKPVSDRTRLGDGAPAGQANHVRFALEQLATLSVGQVSLADSDLSVSGRVVTIEAYDLLRARLSSLPSGLTLTQGLGSADVISPAIRPYLFSAVRGERELTLTGFVPDVQSRKDIIDHASRFFEGDKINDSLQLGLGAPPGFAAVVRGGLQDLSRMVPGAALSLSDQNISLRGLTPLDSASEQTIAAFRARVPGTYNSTVDVNTAPPPPPITVMSECNILFEDLLSRATVNFETGSATIAIESYGLIDRLVVVTRRCEGATVEISGHTDSVGSRESNKTLSESRAKAVVDYLTRAGITNDRIEARGFGPDRPVASNDTAEGRAKNRRIEFKVQ